MNMKRRMSEGDGIDGVRRYPREKYFPTIEDENGRPALHAVKPF